MSHKSAQRFWGSGMHQTEERMSPKSAQRHFKADSVVFGWPIDFGLLTPYIRF